MATMNYESLENLRKGTNSSTIKVRVIRKWKNTSKDVPAFNLLLLDDKDFRIHAFVGNELGNKFRGLLTVGKIYSISRFTVKEYTEKEINLPVELEHQITFSIYTTVKELHDDGVMISNNAFDFYDLGDLRKQGQQDKYLTDVIGILTNLQQLRSFVSYKGLPKKTVKFLLTDGRCKVKVTLWDDHAEEFQRSLTPDMERPLIVIIESGKITLFRDEAEISTYFSTSRVHINYNHPTVTAMRKMLKQPGFGNNHLQCTSVICNRLFTLTEVLALTDEYIDKKIIVQVVIRKVKPISNWIIFECNSCQDPLQIESGKYHCINCKQDVRFPDKKYGVAAICADQTASIAVVIPDRDVHRLTKASVNALVLEKKVNTCPPIIKQLESLEVTILLHITEDNIKSGSEVYNAAEVIEGHHFHEAKPTNNAHQTYMINNISSTTEGSTSSNHSYHLNNLNISSPTPTKPPTGSRYAQTLAYDETIQSDQQ